MTETMPRPGDDGAVVGGGFDDGVGDGWRSWAVVAETSYRVTT